MTRTCPACLHARCGRLFRKNGWEIRGCRACGTWFVADPPPSERLREIYRERYFTEQLAQHSRDERGAAAQRAAVANGRRRLRLLRRLAPKARTILDVGCGTGAFLLAARNEYDVTGVDVSEEAVAVVREHLGLTAHAGDVRTLDLPEESLDVVTLFDAIEHVPKPEGTLRRVRELLAPRGLVVITTGDTDSLVCRISGKRWHLMTPPEHVTFFSRAGLTTMLERCGLSPIHVSHPPVVANVGYMADKLADTLGGPMRVLPPLSNALGIARIDVDVNLLDVVTVVARREPDRKG